MDLLKLDNSVGRCTMLSLEGKQEEGLFNPEVEPYAFQQNDVVGKSKNETSWTSSKYRFLHGELSLQANVIAFFVAEDPLIPTKDTLLMPIAKVCISDIHSS